MTRITRREFIRAAGGFVSAATIAPALLSRAGADEVRKPNILFLMTDQHHHGVLGCAGDPLVKTPNLDKLARDGVRFTNAVCATPFCSPTRASLITGLWPHTHGIQKNVQGKGVGLTDSAVFTEQILFDKGCRTAQMGKWHLGDTAALRCYKALGHDYYPETHKQYLKGIPEDKWDKPRDGDVVIGDVCYTPAMAEFCEKWTRETARSPQNLSTIGRSLIPPEYQYESWLADKCIDLIKKYRDDSFMITWSVSPPHAPWVVPDPYYSMYDPARIPMSPSHGDKPAAAYIDSEPSRFAAGLGEKGLRERLRCYYGQVTFMDALVGRILDALKAQGLDNDTLVIYTSDHGDMQTSHGMTDKSIVAFYEEILRVPLIARYPRTIKPGKVLNAHANSVDLMPTFLDFAGQSIPKGIHGVSLKPLLEGKAADDDRPGFCERGQSIPGTSRMIRTHDWKYCVYGANRRELFDLTNDPYERHDLSADGSRKPIIEELHKRLRQQMEKTNDPALDLLPKA